MSEDVLASRLPLGEGLSGQVIATGQPVYSPDLDDDPRVDPSRRTLGTNAEMHSYLGVPLICLGETIGVMQVDSPDAEAFDADDATVMAGLATLVAGAIESSRRFRQVMELERLKSDFIGRVSHELRTPITIVDGFLSTMLTYGDAIDADGQRNMLERSQAAVGRLAGLIEDLITLSRLETGVLALAPERGVARRAARRRAGPERRRGVGDDPVRARSAASPPIPSCWPAPSASSWTTR